MMQPLQSLMLPPHTQDHQTTHTGVQLQAQLLVIIINNTYSHSIVQKLVLIKGGSRDFAE